MLLRTVVAVAGVHAAVIVVESASAVLNHGSIAATHDNDSSNTTATHGS